MPKNIFNLKWFLALLIFALFLAACSSETPAAIQTQPAQPEVTATPETKSPTEVPPDRPAETAPEPEKTDEPPEISQPISRWNAVTEQGNWVLIGYGDALNPIVVQPNTYVTINFNAIENQVGGSGGCNNYFTGFSADDEGNLTIDSPIGSTLMACQEGMEQEGLYLGALETVSGYSVTDDGYLLLDYDSGTIYDEQLLFIPEKPLIETVWVLTAYGDPNNLTPSKPGIITTATFTSIGTLTGSTGCNNYLAGYTLQGDQIRVDLPTINLAACGTGTDQEQAFLKILDAAQSYRLGVDALEIRSADGSQVLQFSARNLPLENVRWQLTAIDGEAIPEGISANMIFTPADSPVAQNGEAAVNGSAGCNTFFGTYTMAGDTLATGPLGLTRMMCDEAIMQVEQSFLAELEGALSYETSFDGLTINTSTGSLIFVADRIPLEGPRWILTGSGPIDNPQPPIPGTAFTAVFGLPFGMPSGVKAGGTGCNDYTATYYASSDTIKVNLPQTSRRACSDGQLEAEQGYFLGLNAARDYRILGNELYVYYDNSMLAFFGDYAVPEVGPLTPLDGTFWQLTAIDTVAAIAGSETTISFAIQPDGKTGTINGSGGCNTYNANITEVFKLGSINAAKTLCDTPEGIMDQENAYLNALQNANGIFIEGPKLRITTDFETLYFTSSRPQEVPSTPTPTPAALTAAIIAPSNEHEGAVITFDGSLSTPQDGITNFSWWFTGDETANGVSITKTYANTGAYDAILTVTDTTGQKAEASIKVKIHKYLIGPVWTSDSGGITLKFGDATLSGNAGCNDYNAGYTATIDPGAANKLTVEPVSANGQECSEDVMEKEQAYLAALETATRYTITFKSITITSSNGSIIFKGSTP